MLSAINLISYFIILFLLGYYLITNLQWYSYRLERVVFHHTKPFWNYIYFLLPLLTYDFLMGVTHNRFGFIVAIIYLPIFILWHRGLSKPLVFTSRVKRFFAILALFGLFFPLALSIYSLFMPLLIAWGISVAIEKMLFFGFYKRAQKRLDSMDNLTIIGVTASYGKTSIKNFLASILSKKYRVYATPRSVNTLGGVVKDINESLPKETQIYIVEMGARAKGDIKEITHFVKPHYAVVGKIGLAHIEYFKSLEAIRDTKMEILDSQRLIEAWVHKSANIKPTKNIHSFGDEINSIEATLDKTCFNIDKERFCAKVLGAFNAINLTASIYVAKALGLNSKEIQRTLDDIKPTPHRLQKIEAGGKLILDDSFNGNIDGVLEAFRLASTWQGRRVLITPGLVEVDSKLNQEVAKRANEVFDLIIVTSDLNYPIFKEFVDKDKLIHLRDKSKLEETLAKKTKSGDLILFANDAPSFI